jgi:hypothetical protein
MKKIYELLYVTNINNSINLITEFRNKNLIFTGNRWINSSECVWDGVVEGKIRLKDTYPTLESLFRPMFVTQSGVGLYTLLGKNERRTQVSKTFTVCILAVIFCQCKESWNCNNNKDVLSIWEKAHSCTGYSVDELIDALQFVLPHKKDIIHQFLLVYYFNERNDLKALYYCAKNNLRVDAQTCETLFNDRNLCACIKQNGRVKQSIFRENVGKMYPVCPISGCKTLSLLEAAHIMPVAGNETHEELMQAKNGIMLRVDLHRAFDQYLWTIKYDLATKTCSIYLGDAMLADDTYKHLDTKAVDFKSDTKLLTEFRSTNRVLRTKERTKEPK